MADEFNKVVNNIKHDGDEIANSGDNDAMKGLKVVGAGVRNGVDLVVGVVGQIGGSIIGLFG